MGKFTIHYPLPKDFCGQEDLCKVSNHLTALTSSYQINAAEGSTTQRQTALRTLCVFFGYSLHVGYSNYGFLEMILSYFDTIRNYDGPKFLQSVS